MSLKKLDLEEFYQEENAYYQQMGTNAPFGLGGVVLITPIQSIGVYNEEALNYLRTNKGKVFPEINLSNVYKKENIYEYQEEEVKRTR